jgi:hypothetical protein
VVGEPTPMVIDLTVIQFNVVLLVYQKALLLSIKYRWCKHRHRRGTPDISYYVTGINGIDESNR